MSEEPFRLVPDTAVLASVRTFLGAPPSHPCQSDIADLPLVARPARLGLGAAWTGKHSVAGGPEGIAAAGHRRLSASLRIENPRPAARADSDSASDSDPGHPVSRAQIPRRLTKKRSKKAQVAPPPPSAPPSAPPSKHVSETNADDDVDPAFDEDGFPRAPPDATTPASAPTPVPFETVPATVFKKRRKKRSRQKNLRKDSRPPHRLPSYLSPATLSGPRVYRHPSSSATAVVPKPL